MRFDLLDYVANAILMIEFSFLPIFLAIKAVGRISKAVVKH
jgi:hypothetical protein